MKFAKKPLCYALLAVMTMGQVATVSATSTPVRPQSYGSGATSGEQIGQAGVTGGVTRTPINKNTGNTNDSHAGHNHEGHSHGSPNDGQNCAISEEAEAVLSEKIDEVINQGQVMGSVIENFQKSETTKNCLAGFTDNLNLAELIPTVSITGFNAAAIRTAITNGVKQAVQQQKERIRNRVCQMADNALSGALEHLQGEIQNVNGILNIDVGSAIEGYAIGQIGRANGILDKQLGKHLDRLDKKLAAGQQKVENITATDNNIAQIANEINQLASQASNNNTGNTGGQTAPTTPNVPIITLPTPKTPTPTPTTTPTTPNNTVTPSVPNTAVGGGIGGGRVETTPPPTTPAQNSNVQRPQGYGS